METTTSGLEVKVRLVILGFECSSDEISSTLGVAPTQVWRDGETVTPQATNVHHENGWMLRSPVDPQRASAEEAVNALLAQFPSLKAFAALPAAADIQLTCTIYGHDERPGLWLSKDVIARLAQIGASLDVDVYDLIEYTNDKV